MRIEVNYSRYYLWHESRVLRDGVWGWPPLLLPGSSYSGMRCAAQTIYEVTPQAHAVPGKASHGTAEGGHFDCSPFGRDGTRRDNGGQLLVPTALTMSAKCTRQKLLSRKAGRF